MKKLAFILLTLLLAPGCDKRYEEGPCLSFVKAENRLCGLWSVSSMQLNEQERAGDTTELYRFSVFRNLEGSLYIQLTDTAGLVIAESLIRTDERLTELRFALVTIQGYEEDSAPLFRHCPALFGEAVWTILRLKREEMRLRTDYAWSRVIIDFSLETDYQHL